MKKFAIFISWTVVFLGQNVFSSTCIQDKNKIKMVGLDSRQSTIYASVAESNNACGCRSFRFSEENTGGNNKMALSILLTAKATGKLVRVDLLDESNCNSAFRVYLY